ncbi:MAG: arginase [Bdellovibrionota bacterium]
MKHIKFLGIPFSAGQPLCGVEHAPDILRNELRNDELEIDDLGDLDFSLCGEHTSGIIKNEKLCGLGNALISEVIAGENLKDSFLLNVGGDHGLALGTIHGLLHHYPDLIVVWVDAHGDINTPLSSSSGNFHGMPLSFLMNGCQGREDFQWLRKRLPANRLIYMGPRDLDSEEKAIIEDAGIQYYSSDDINEFGSELLLQHALRIADPERKCRIHLSFDVDVFDGNDVEATGTRVMNGPRRNEILKLGSLLGQTGRLVSMDLVEINPDIAQVDKVSETIQLSLQFTLGVLNNLVSEKSEEKKSRDNALLFHRTTDVPYPVRMRNYQSHCFSEPYGHLCHL